MTDKADEVDDVVLKETYEQYCRVEDELAEVVAAINDVETDTHPFNNHDGHNVKVAFERIQEFRERVTEERFELKNENKDVLMEYE